MRLYTLGFALALSITHATLAATPSTNKNEDKSMLRNKPNFTLHLNMQSCRYLVSLNGVQISRDDKGHSTTVNIPVNHWMRTGANELSLAIRTFDGKYPISPEARCEVSLQVRPDDLSEAHTATISRLVFSGKKAGTWATGIEESTVAGHYDSTRQFFAKREGDVSVSATTIEPHQRDPKSKMVRQTITLTTPFPEWAFFKSDNLPTSLEIKTMTDAEFDHYIESIYA